MRAHALRKSALRLLLTGALAAGLTAPATAREQSTRIIQTFRFDPIAGQAGKPLVARKGRPLLTAEIRGLDVVTIDTPVVVTVVNGVKIRSQRPIAAGDILQGWPGMPGVYCAPARESPLYVTAACLQDADGDGRFEASVSASFTDQSAEAYNIGHKGGLVALTRDTTTPLATPLPYRKANPVAGPAARVKLDWVLAKPTGAEEPPTVILSLDASVTRASYAFSLGERFPLPGGTGDINFHGLLIHVSGIDPDGSIRYTLEGAMAGDPIEIGFLFMRPPVVIYIPV